MPSRRFGLVALIVAAAVAAVGGGILGSLLPRTLPELLTGMSGKPSGTQIVEAVTKEQEVSLVSLSIQGVEEQTSDGSVFGVRIPGSTRTSFILYSYDAKLGIDGTAVTVSIVDDTTVHVHVPEFMFIGDRKSVV